MDQNPMQLTLWEYTEQTFPQQPCGVSERLAKTFPWLIQAGPDLEETEVLWLEKCSDCLKKKNPEIDPNGLSTRMLRECFLAITDGTLPTFKLKWGGVGYDVEWQILNSKDFGVPQNRERVYTIGHFRGYGCKQILPFPSSCQETCVQQIARQPSKSRDNTNVHRVYATDGIAPTLSKMEGGGRQPFIIEDFYKSRDARCYHETAPTLRKDRQGLKVSDTLNNIRRLTPRECMRLQGVPDAITDKLIAAGISDAQMYRAAGDAVTISVAYEVAKQIKGTMKGEKK